MPLIRKTISRGINVRMIVPLPAGSKIDKEFRILLKFPNFKLKTIEEKPVAGFNVWDHEQTLISTSKDDTPLPQPTLWSNSKAIVHMAENYFECVWKVARDATNSENMSIRKS